MTQSHRHLCLIVLCATAVRVVYFLQFQDNPFFAYIPRSWDQGIYYEGGLAFSRGDYLAVAPVLDNHFSPAYQYFLGILFLVFGGNLEVAWVAQFLLGIFSTVLVYSIACKFFSRTAGLIAALLFTFYAPNWLYEGSLYRASLIVFLELATVRIMLAVKNRPKLFLLISSALVLGLFMQVRSNNLLIFPVVLYYLWQQIDVGRNKWPLIGGYILLVAMVCAPALLWVKEVRGQWGLYDKSGPENLLLSNTLDHSVRTYEHNETYREVLESIPLETGPIFKYILETIRDHPLEFLILYLKKTYYYFNNYEIPVTVNFYLSQEFSPILGWGIPFVVIGALGLCGGALLWNRKGWTPLHSFFLFSFLIFIPFLILSRYRLYSVPFLCIFSGYFLVVFKEWFEERKWKAVTSSLICVMGLGLLFKTSPLPEGKIRIDDLANIGSAYLNNDQLEDDFMSYNYYRRAHDLSQSLEASLQKPKKIRRLFHDYQFFKAKKFVQGDEGEKALGSLERALAYEYSMPVTHHIYAQELFKNEILGGALIEALMALELRGDSKETHLLLGAIYSKLSYSPYWLVFHLEQVLEQLQGSEYETLSKSLTQIRNQLGLPDPMKSFSETEQKKKFVNLLSPTISPIIEFTFDPVLSSDADQQSPQESLSYMIMLYQRLLLFPDDRKADIHYQLGMLYWKRENRLSAATYHLEKAWDLGRQSPHLRELIKLDAQSLTFDDSR
jgi:4-amino-4-deoxy-L-arabinose transferase-like glycosyltransferase